MKQILTLFFLLLLSTSDFGQNGLSGTYIMESGPLDKYIFKTDSSFSFYREDCRGHYYGDGKYFIKNDSLFLQFYKNESNKTVFKINITHSKDTLPKLILKIYRKDNPTDNPRLERNNLTIELLDSSKNMIGIFTIKNKNGYYEVSDNKLNQTGYIRLNKLGNEEIFKLPDNNFSVLSLTITTVNQFFNQIISDEVRNKGKITIVSNTEFILNKWGYDITYKKQN